MIPYINNNSNNNKQTKHKVWQKQFIRLYKDLCDCVRESRVCNCAVSVFDLSLRALRNFRSLTKRLKRFKLNCKNIELWQRCILRDFPASNAGCPLHGESTLQPAVILCSLFYLLLSFYLTFRSICQLHISHTVTSMCVCVPVSSDVNKIIFAVFVLFAAVSILYARLQILLFEVQF